MRVESEAPPGHLAGACTDTLAGNPDGVTTAAWADTQVAERADRPVSDLLAEWEEAGGRLEGAVDHLPGHLPLVWVLDLLTHEQDVRGALGRPGGRDVPAMDMALAFLVEKGLLVMVRERQLGALAVRTPTQTWSIGGEGGPDPAGPAVASSAFELFRSLTGRRSRAQIAGLEWTVDPEPYLPCFQFGTFTTRATDLFE